MSGTGAHRGPVPGAEGEDLAGMLAALLKERFERLEEAGRGAMAVVFRATDLRYGRTVAIKVLKPQIAALMGTERFLQEIGFASRLQHPAIVPLYESGIAGGLPYFVMPFVPGLRLRDRLSRESQLPLDEVVRYTREIAGALDYAHAQGVVHRDIKPENILLAGDRVMVADFGLARAMSAADDGRLTQDGLAVGTPEYMSPEQIDPAKPIDARTDVYSLGCVIFEMLAGEPPFSGRSIQTVLARHLAETPPSLEVLRSALPPEVSRVVGHALAKVPADRFPSAGALAEALDAAARPEGRALPFGRLAALVAGLALLVVLVLLARPIWRALHLAFARSDPNRVLVFPLADRMTPPEALTGEDIAAYIGYALEGTAALRWEEGGAWLTPEERADPRRTSRLRQREIALGRHAPYFIDGTVLRGPDSVRVVLSLYDAAGDSIVRRAGRAGRASASEAQLGVLAVGDLIPAMVEPERRVDVAPLSDRRPTAIALFLLGERAYRRTRFAEALPLYESAIAADSAFAMAALKGAQAASWTEQYERAEALARLAVANGASLPARYRHLIEGLALYLGGSPDSALARLQQALAQEPAWSEAWTAVGETYFHLLPARGPADSLATDAFRRAWEADTGFTPPLFHLTQLAVRHGAVEEAERLRRLFVRREVDSSLTHELDLMIGCARGTVSTADWRASAATSFEEVLDVARLLAPIPAYRDCAEAGYQALLAAPLQPAYRFAALYGLQSMLVAAGRYEAARRLLESPVSDSLRGEWFYLMDVGVGAPFQAQAESVATASGSDYGSQSTVRLWAIGVYYGSRGTAEPIGAISRALTAKAEPSGTRSDAQFSAIIAAHAALAAGDSLSAERRFASLRPVARRNELAWSLCGPLGFERLRWAQLLLALGRPQAAIQVAELLEAPQPGGYLLYLPGSLEVRARASAAMNRREQERGFTRRLLAVQGPGAAR